MTKALCAIAALTASFLPIVSASAQDSSERIPGKCAPATEFETKLFTLMGYQGSMHINCDGAEVDWDRAVTFTKQSGGPLISLLGHRGDNEFSLIVEAIDDLAGKRPATGRCRMFLSDDPGGDRTLACFAREERESAPQAVSINFVVAEITPAIGQAIAYSGACTRSEAMDFVLSVDLERTHEKELPPLHSPPVACDAAAAITGKSFSFSQHGKPVLSFTGQPSDKGARIIVETVAFGANPPLPVLAGSCISMRMLDGDFGTSCGAAYQEGDEIKSVSLDFQMIEATL